jgi:hypothetical protein
MATTKSAWKSFRPRVRTGTAIFIAAVTLWVGLWVGVFGTQLCGPPPHDQRSEYGDSNKDIADLQKDISGSARPSTTIAQIPSQESKTKQQQSAGSGYCSSYFTGVELINVKITDLLIALFTYLLFIKTAGLYSATRGLQRASIKQSADMKESIAAANSLADAARESAETAMKALEGDRAWIMWNRLIWNSLIHSTIDGVLYRRSVAFSAEWRVTGRSPALNVSCVNIVRIVDISASAPSFVVGDGDRETEKTGCGPEDKISGFGVPITDDEFIAFTNRLKKIIFYSIVTYTDIFDLNRERVSETCLEIVFAGGRIHGSEGEHVPLSQRVVGSQNRKT